MTPTDEQLNIAMAEACGWANVQEGANTPTGPSACGTVPDDRPSPWNNGRAYIPRFCTDRNTLPEVWATVGSMSATSNCRGYIEALADVIKNDLRWHAIIASPREHVIAALKALGKWPVEWEAE